MHNQSESRVKERGKNMDIFIKEYNAKVKTLEFVKKAYGKCSFGSVDLSYQYLLGYANALYDCGLITANDLQRAFDTTEKLFEEFK